MKISNIKNVPSMTKLNENTETKKSTVPLRINRLKPVKIQQPAIYFSPNNRIVHQNLSPYSKDKIYPQIQHVNRFRGANQIHSGGNNIRIYPKNNLNSYDTKTIQPIQLNKSPNQYQNQLNKIPNQFKNKIQKTPIYYQNYQNEYQNYPSHPINQNLVVNKLISNKQTNKFSIQGSFQRELQKQLPNYPRYHHQNKQPPAIYQNYEQQKHNKLDLPKSKIFSPSSINNLSKSRDQFITFNRLGSGFTKTSQLMPKSSQREFLELQSENSNKSNLTKQFSSNVKKKHKLKLNQKKSKENANALSKLKYSQNPLFQNEYFDVDQSSDRFANLQLEKNKKPKHNFLKISKSLQIFPSSRSKMQLQSKSKLNLQSRGSRNKINFQKMYQNQDFQYKKSIRGSQNQSLGKQSFIDGQIEPKKLVKMEVQLKNKNYLNKKVKMQNPVHVIKTNEAEEDGQKTRLKMPSFKNNNLRKSVENLNIIQTSRNFNSANQFRKIPSLQLKVADSYEEYVLENKQIPNIHCQTYKSNHAKIEMPNHMRVPVIFHQKNTTNIFYENPSVQVSNKAHSKVFQQNYQHNTRNPSFQPLNFQGRHPVFINHQNNVAQAGQAQPNQNKFIISPQTSENLRTNKFFVQSSNYSGKQIISPRPHSSISHFYTNKIKQDNVMHPHVIKQSSIHQGSRFNENVILQNDSRHFYNSSEQKIKRPYSQSYSARSLSHLQQNSTFESKICELAQRQRNSIQMQLNSVLHPIQENKFKKQLSELSSVSSNINQILPMNTQKRNSILPLNTVIEYQKSQINNEKQEQNRNHQRPHQSVASQESNYQGSYSHAGISSIIMNMKSYNNGNSYFKQNNKTDNINNLAYCNEINQRGKEKIAKVNCKQSSSSSVNKPSSSSSANGGMPLKIENNLPIDSKPNSPHNFILGNPSNAQFSSNPSNLQFHYGNNQLFNHEDNYRNTSKIQIEQSIQINENFQMRQNGNFHQQPHFQQRPGNSHESVIRNANAIILNKNKERTISFGQTPIKQFYESQNTENYRSKNSLQQNKNTYTNNFFNQTNNYNHQQQENYNFHQKQEHYHNSNPNIIQINIKQSSIIKENEPTEQNLRQSHQGLLLQRDFIQGNNFQTGNLLNNKIIRNNQLNNKQGPNLDLTVINHPKVQFQKEWLNINREKCSTSQYTNFDNFRKKLQTIEANKNIITTTNSQNNQFFQSKHPRQDSSNLLRNNGNLTKNDGNFTNNNYNLTRNNNDNLTRNNNENLARNKQTLQQNRNQINSQQPMRKLDQIEKEHQQFRTKINSISQNLLSMTPFKLENEQSRLGKEQICYHQQFKYENSQSKLQSNQSKNIPLANIIKTQKNQIYYPNKSNENIVLIRQKTQQNSKIIKPANVYHEEQLQQSSQCNQDQDLSYEYSEEEESASYKKSFKSNINQDLNDTKKISYNSQKNNSKKQIIKQKGAKPRSKILNQNKSNISNVYSKMSSQVNNQLQSNSKANNSQFQSNSKVNNSRNSDCQLNINNQSSNPHSWSTANKNKHIIAKIMVSNSNLEQPEVQYYKLPKPSFHEISSSQQIQNALINRLSDSSYHQVLYTPIESSQIIQLSSLNSLSFQFVKSNCQPSYKQMSNLANSKGKLQLLKDLEQKEQNQGQESQLNKYNVRQHKLNQYSIGQDKLNQYSPIGHRQSNYDLNDYPQELYNPISHGTYDSKAIGNDPQTQQKRLQSSLGNKKNTSSLLKQSRYGVAEDLANVNNDYANVNNDYSNIDIDSDAKLSRFKGNLYQNYSPQLIQNKSDLQQQQQPYYEEQSSDSTLFFYKNKDTQSEGNPKKLDYQRKPERQQRRKYQQKSKYSQKDQLSGKINSARNDNLTRNNILVNGGESDYQNLNLGQNLNQKHLINQEHHGFLPNRIEVSQKILDFSQIKLGQSSEGFAPSSHLIDQGIFYYESRYEYASGQQSPKQKHQQGQNYREIQQKNYISRSNFNMDDSKNSSSKIIETMKFY